MAYYHNVKAGARSRREGFDAEMHTPSLFPFMKNIAKTILDDGIDYFAQLEEFPNPPFCFQTKTGRGFPLMWMQWAGLVELTFSTVVVLIHVTVNDVAPPQYRFLVLNQWIDRVPCYRAHR